MRGKSCPPSYAVEMCSTFLVMHHTAHVVELCGPLLVVPHPPTCPPRMRWKVYKTFLAVLSTLLVPRNERCIPPSLRLSPTLPSPLPLLALQCPEAPQSYDEYLFFDVLWSDPHPDDADGVHESSRGDGCILFGKDITAEFLRRNSLQLLIRSHQLPSDGHGYEILHDGKCITVFSASNYGGNCFNAGSVLLWENGEIDAHEFIAPALAELDHAMVTGKGGEEMKRLFAKHSSRGEHWEDEVGCAAEPSHVARLDGEIVRMVRERICRCKGALHEAFRMADEMGNGLISEAAWSSVLTGVLKVGREG